MSRVVVTARTHIDRFEVVTVGVMIASAVAFWFAH